jgi:hypothetical protein
MKVINYRWFIVFAAIQLVACKSFVAMQPKELYDQPATVSTNEINGFKAVNIFSDNMDNSVWVSPEPQCIKLSQERKNVSTGAGSLHVKWDKPAGGCKWIGIGFGWNNWMAKDLIDVSQIAAIQLQVKAVSGSFKNFPVAFALEDYSGIQCYYGFTPELAAGEFNDTSWTAVTIPISKFDFESKDFDQEKVKQFAIQLEGEGDIYLDDIKIIRIKNEQN